ncbi:hypothetical protein IE53DRAFT_388137 [Violaceomyces palustris]|uniref:Uncharacterized protein n=1 Tax=Violaceomyces palustris TaxID=1673888 RepID=A0ACD0NUX3_9BASI|nr:hypothetical protein IE53DRAFT_388137 [Violaceomyces palustris]
MHCRDPSFLFLSLSLFLFFLVRASKEGGREGRRDIETRKKIRSTCFLGSEETAPEGKWWKGRRRKGGVRVRQSLETLPTIQSPEMNGIGSTGFGLAREGAEE